MNGMKRGPQPGDVQLLFGQASLDDWAKQGVGKPVEPWRSFERAQALFRAGDPGRAVEAWREIPLRAEVSSQAALQAWHFVRQAGSPPPDEIAKVALGAAAEVPMNGSHDLLVAYRDGTANYVNYSGKTITWNDRSSAHVQAAVSRWLAAAEVIARSIGPWRGPSLPPLSAGQARVTALTASGPHFGQGPQAALSGDPLASAFLSAATRVMQLMVTRAMA